MTGKREVKVRGLTFDVRTGGSPDGPLVLLLHGFPAGARSYAAVMHAMRGDGLFLVAPDQRGYSPGARPPAVADYTIEKLAQDVLDLADALGHPRLHLVGHDWGASVAWYLAAYHPERVRSLVAVSVPHLAAYGQALREDPDQRARAAYLKLLRSDKAERVLLDDDARRLRAFYGEGMPEADRAAYLANFAEPGALTAALAWYRAMRSDLGKLPPVRVPTTYLWSTADAALGRFGAERCAAHVQADYRFVELEGVSHWIPEEAPAALAEAIRQRIAG